jgi:hypothetical protein
MLAGIGIKIGLALGAAGIVVSGYFYVQTLKSDLELAQANTTKAMEVVTSQQVVMVQLQKDIKRIQTITSDLNKKLAQAEKNVVSLSNKFDTTSSGQARDVGKDAVASPTAVEKVINRATKDAIRCGELVTGAQPKPDETNSQCPDLVPGGKLTGVTSGTTNDKATLDIRSTIK